MNECLGQRYVCNGKLTKASLFDNSFLYGPDYVYEVFRVIDGIALFLEDHLERFMQTCRLAGIVQPTPVDEINHWVYQLVEAEKLRMGNMKMVMLRNNDDECRLLVYITPHEYPTHEMFKEGVAVSLFRGIRHNPNAKVMDVQLREANNRLKATNNVYETLLVDGDGNITEGSRSNVFFVRDGILFTPPVEDVLPGITRKHVIEVCRMLELEVREEKVLARSVVVMEALFITGTSRKVLPVHSIDGVPFDARHPVVCKVQEAFNNHVNAYLEQHKS
jgi:branched-chain amino acid aminotransferase